MFFYTLKLPRVVSFFTVFLIILGAILYFNNAIEILQTSGSIEPIYQGNPEEKHVAFACNVAWGEEILPDLLKILKEKDVKITFFVEGRWAESFPKLLKAIKEDGHEIGNHGYSHRKPVGLSKEENIKEIKKAEEAIYKITGCKTTLFAPPYGEFDETTLNAVEDLGYKVIMWTIDTVDWKEPGKNYIINKVMKKLQNGAIILMHPKKDTAEALPELIEKLREKEFKITTVTEVIN